MVNKISIKDYEKEIQEENYEKIYRDIVDKSMELVKEIGKIKNFEIPKSDNERDLFFDIECYFKENSGCFTSVVNLMKQLSFWYCEDLYIAPTEIEKIKFIIPPYNCSVEELEIYQNIKKKIAENDYEKMIEERKNKVRNLYIEMLEYKNKSYDKNWGIAEFTPKLVHYYNFYHSEFKQLESALLNTTVEFDVEEKNVELDRIERIMLIDEIYNLLLPTSDYDGYKEFAYEYRDFDLKEGQTYDDLYDIEEKRLIEVFKKMLEFIGINDFEEDFEKLRIMVIEKYPWYKNNLSNFNSYNPYVTYIERLNNMEDTVEKLSQDYKNYEENMKKYKKMKESKIDESDDDIFLK